MPPSPAATRPSRSSQSRRSSNTQSRKLRRRRGASPVDEDIGGDDDDSASRPSTPPPVVTSARRRSSRSRTQSPVLGVGVDKKIAPQGQRKTQNSNKVNAATGSVSTDDDDEHNADSKVTSATSQTSSANKSPAASSKTRSKKRLRPATPEVNDDEGDVRTKPDRKVARLSNRGTPTPRKRAGAGETLLSHDIKFRSSALTLYRILSLLYRKRSC